jgi:hypothetical protein
MTVPTSGQTMDASTDADAAIAPDVAKTRGRVVTVFVGASGLLLLIPIALYFWFIHQYGVNAIYYDQWNDVALLTHTRYFFEPYSGHTTITMLWTQHNESRTFFPNLIVLALGALTHLNILTELYLSAVLLLIALFLIILAHRRDVAPTRLIFYLPVAFLMLILGQFENTLFGYQMSWYLAITALAAAIFLLNLPRLGWLVLVAAIGMAVVGSYSALQGLLIWPAGLVVLLWKQRPRAFVLTWLISATATTGLYFYHFDFAAAAGGSHSYVLAHPLSAAEFFFFDIGDVMGKPLSPGPGASDKKIVAIGVAIFLLAVVCLSIYGRRRSLSRSPVGPALICFGILFAVWVTIGRTYVGLWAASQSRYETQNLLILVGCYLCLLERWPAHDEEIVTASFTVDTFRNVDQLGRTLRQEWRQGLLLGLRVVAVLLIVVEVEGGIANGLPSGAYSRQAYQLDNLVAAHAADAPDSLIKSALFPNHGYPDANIRGLAEAAKKDHLSFFATSEASRLARMNLPKTEYSPPKTSVGKPADGTLLRGQVYLVAKASSDYPITSVDFQIRSSGGQQVKLLHGYQFPYGWLGNWFTTDLPNGPYTVQSIAKDITGHSSTSQAVPITVEN